MMNTKEIKKGIYFHSIMDKRFKSNQISVNFIVGMNSNTVSSNAILPFLLKKRCKKYPDMLSLGKKLQELYGANLFADCRKIGDNQIMTLGILTIDDSLAINGEPLNELSSELLASVIFEPMVENNKFIEDDINIEKENLIELIEGEYNDKRLYALNRSIYYLFDGKGYGCNKYGSVDFIRPLTNLQILNAYNNLLSSAKIHIMFTGKGNAFDCLNVFSKRFSSIDRSNVYKPQVNKYIKKASKSKVDIDKVAQSKLVMGFAISNETELNSESALVVMTALFGGTPISKLFVNVREKLSLCYYCVARYDKAKGVIWVDSGVENDNINRAKRTILDQLEEIKNGNFSDDVLNKTVLFVINNLKSVGDSTYSVENYYLAQLCGNEVNSPKEKIEDIKKVTKEDVINAAKSYSLAIDYVLTGEDK